ncbi:Fic family protein [Brucella pituitosa]
METIFRAYNAIPITENHIRQFHRDLLAHSTKDERHRGEWKTLDNHVEAFDENGRSLGVVFATATPFDTPRLMDELVTWLREREETKDLYPLRVVGIFVVVFLAIHPFQDGNVRLLRVLTTLLLLRAGYAYMPYISLESVIEQSKEGTTSRCGELRGRSEQARRTGTHGSSFSCALSNSRSNSWSGRWNASASSSVTCLSCPSRSLNSRANMAG